MAKVVYLDARNGERTESEAERMRRELEQLVDIESMRKAMTPDAIATVAAMTSLLREGDLRGALNLLEQRAVRLEDAGDAPGASATRGWEHVVKGNPIGAIEFGDLLLNSKI